MKNLTIFLDGKYQTILPSAMKAMTPGLLRGLGVFETLLCEKQKVFFFREHYQRFVHGCDRYILPKPVASKNIRQILAQLLQQNKIKDGRVRFAAWRKGSDLHFSVAVFPRKAFSESVYRRGFAACLYPRALNRPSQLHKIKSLDYGFFLKAYEFALKHHYEEAILLNSEGHIIEGSRSNIFFVKDRKLFTPSLSTGCLNGTTRQAVLKVAKAIGIKTANVESGVLDLQNSDEAFLTNSLVGIMPLTYLQDQKIGDGRPGRLTLKLTKSYKKLSQGCSTFVVG